MAKPSFLSLFERSLRKSKGSQVLRGVALSLKHRGYFDILSHIGLSRKILSTMVYCTCSTRGEEKLEKYFKNLYYSK
jgi:hypothetical protein